MNSAEFDAAIVLGKSRSDCHSSNIDSLVHIVNELANVPGDIAECGSYKCGATIAMAAAAEYHKTYKIVMAFDLFGGLPYGEGKGFENFVDATFQEVFQAIKPFHIIPVRGPHEATMPGLHTWFRGVLSLIFMDSDFYESHVVCLTHLWPLLSSGGMVVFHDWSFKGVQKAIAETIPAEQILDSGTVSTSPNMGYITKR
jgi:Macrocin-O-methyltransferase (TylF)